MVPDFDVSSVRPDSVAFIIGKRMTGKTTIALDLVTRSGIGFGMAVSPLAPICPGEYADVPFVADEWHPKLVENMLKRQSAAIKDAVADPRAFVVLDNCMYDSKWHEDAHVRNMFICNRSSKLLVVMTMAYPIQVPPSIKAKVEYVFVLRENSTENRRRTWQAYVEGIATFEDFCALMDSLTDYWCVVVDNLQDKLFKYKVMRPAHSDASSSVVRPLHGCSVDAR